MSTRNFESVVIVTYARSGSTLLMGLLNSVDGVLVRGENHNFIYSLYQSQLRLEKTKANSEHGCTSVSAWFGANAIDLEKYNESCKSLIRGVLVPENRASEITCYGFKEIRYLNQAQDLNEYMKYLRSVFPNLAIVFNTRKIEDVVVSSLWQKRNTKKAVDKIQQGEGRFRSYHSRNADHSICVRHEETVKNGPEVERLFGFLGFPYDRAAVAKLLKVPHSVRIEE